jgi:hypothetical protein
MRGRPLALLLAAAVEAVEAAGLCFASALSGVGTATGQSYQLSSGIALTVIGFCVAAGLAVVAAGLGRARRWSRTPAVLTQLFTGIIAIYLLEGHRLDWGIPALLLALAGFAGILVPPSMRALTGGSRTAPAARQAVPPRR